MGSENGRLAAAATQEGGEETQAPPDRDIEFHRKMMRHIFAMCQLWFVWRTGKKPPGLKDILS